MSFTPAVCHCVICRIYVDNDFPNPLVAQWTDKIREYGWTPVGITGDLAGWAHTVGMWHSFRLPELAIFGYLEEIHAPFLKNLVDQILAGQEMPEGTTIDLQGSGLPPLVLKEVAEGWGTPFFGAAIGFYRQTPSVPFLQISHSGDEPQLWLSPDEHPENHWREHLDAIP